ncbi:hypothetical protein KUTeg_003837 [Tegillarca granosa]|uniref:L-xylulose reductase n=1 Tax=Tegillarca granosa TaxID=220873 RepID=A0ABQ9FRG4_TEGGR|nr:hypothetical protein KUTeg_003837 [Tegillarca granosa]
MEYRFDGKSALVTGGSRGIGKAIAIGLLNAGAEVYVLGKSEENLKKLKQEYPEIHTVHADLTNWDTTRSEVEKLGHIDLLVNNAGIEIKANFMNTTRETFEKVIDSNLKGAFNVSQVIAKSMIDRKTGGSIVNISSVDSTRPSREAVTYSISKAGLDMMTKGMALELGPHQIRVNNVNPTYVPTDMTKDFYADSESYAKMVECHPLKKLAELEDVMNAVLFLLSEKASCERDLFS